MNFIWFRMNFNVDHQSLEFQEATEILYPKRFDATFILAMIGYAGFTAILGYIELTYEFQMFNLSLLWIFLNLMGLITLDIFKIKLFLKPVLLENTSFKIKHNSIHFSLLHQILSLLLVFSFFAILNQVLNGELSLIVAGFEFPISTMVLIVFGVYFYFNLLLIRPLNFYLFGIPFWQKPIPVELSQTNASVYFVKAIQALPIALTIAAAMMLHSLSNISLVIFAIFNLTLIVQVGSLRTEREHFSSKAQEMIEGYKEKLPLDIYPQNNARSMQLVSALGLMDQQEPLASTPIVLSHEFTESLFEEVSPEPFHHSYSSPLKDLSPEEARKSLQRLIEKVKEEDPQYEERSDKSNYMYCISCGIKNDHSNSFCFSCGTNLNE